MYKTYQNKSVINDIVLLYEVTNDRLAIKSETNKYPKRVGVFICPFCDSEFKTEIYNVKSGRTTSCGCKRKDNIKEIRANKLAKRE